MLMWVIACVEVELIHQGDSDDSDTCRTNIDVHAHINIRVPEKMSVSAIAMTDPNGFLPWLNGNLNLTRLIEFRTRNASAKSARSAWSN